MTEFNITIVGLGLIGGSIAMALKDLNIGNIWAVDKDPDTISSVDNLGLVNKVYKDPKIPLSQSDIVIIALHPDDCVDFIKNNRYNFKNNAIITDTGGIKKDLIKEIESMIPNNIDFIGGHPIAGVEGQGFEKASKEMFKESTYILTPTKSNKRKNIDILKALIFKLGCDSVIEMSPSEHDEIIAITSHLPHIISVSLINSFNLDEKRNATSMIGGSFESATRVADINSKLWSEIFIKNDENILRGIEVFEKNIKMLKDLIIAKDKEGIKKVLDNVNKKKGRLY